MDTVKTVINNATSFLALLDDLKSDEGWIKRLERVNTRAYVALMEELARVRKYLIRSDPVTRSELDALIRELDSSFVGMYPNTIEKYTTVH